MMSLVILMIYALLGVVFAWCTRTTVSKEERAAWYTLSTVMWPIMLGHKMGWENK